MIWLLLDDKLLFTNDSVLVVLFIVIWLRLLQLSWFVLTECNFRKVGWVLGSTIAVLRLVESAKTCMCRAFKLQEWKRDGDPWVEQHSLKLLPEKKNYPNYLICCWFIWQVLNLKTNIKLLECRENCLACCLLGISIIWSIYLYF